MTPVRPSSPPALGLMCGTFDPPHIGHLLLAETAASQLQLDHVLFLPVGQPTHKTILTAAHHRLAMTQLAIADNDCFSLNTTDLERPSPHYTATLLPLLQQQYPFSSLWLLLGGDSLRDLPTWHRPGELLHYARLAVLERPGAIINWPELMTKIPNIQQAVTLLEGPSVNISSTLIRQFVISGHSLRYLLPPAVQQYMDDHQLYQGS